MGGVDGIPSFMIFHPDGTLITEDGRGKVMKDPKGEQFPQGWEPQPFADIDEARGSLSDTQCLVLFNGSDAANAAVKAVAEEQYAASGKVVGNMDKRFCAAPPGDFSSMLLDL